MTVHLIPNYGGNYGDNYGDTITVTVHLIPAYNRDAQLAII